MTELLEIDQLSMDRINPYTATGTFGVSYNGGHKSTEALPWMLPREEPAEAPEEDKPEYLDHFVPAHLFRAPAMAAMTGSVDPATSFMFPARKIQYDDGTTSWSREVLWRKDDGSSAGIPMKDSMWPIILALIILVIVLSFRRKLNL